MGTRWRYNQEVKFISKKTTQAGQAGNGIGRPKNTKRGVTSHEQIRAG